MPGRSKPVEAFKVIGDREVCLKTPRGRLEYHKRRQMAWLRDEGQCILCQRFVPLEFATVEHIQTKGMGGANHDDRLQNLAVSHLWGNIARGSMSLPQYLKKSEAERVRLCQSTIFHRTNLKEHQ